MAASKTPWQKEFNRLNDSSFYMLQNEILTDCSFAVGKGDARKTIKAHKFVLIQVSRVFERMFCGPFVQASEGIDESETDPDVFAQLLRFIYKDALNFDDVKTAMKIYILADKYEIWKVMKSCIDFIMDNVEDSDFLEVYEFLSRYSLMEEASFCKKMLVKNAGKIFQSPDFVNISKSTVLTILRENCLNVESELEVYNAAIRWIDSEIERREIADDAQKRNICNELMSEIRFLSMNIKDFADRPASQHYLDLKDSIAIFANLSSESTPIKLPSNFSKSKRRYGWEQNLPENWPHQLLHAAKNGDLPKMRSLAAGGANIKIESKEGTFLHYAAGFGYEDMTTWLINKGIPVNSRNKYHGTPLWIASSNGRLGTVMLLLAAGADPDIPDSHGHTPREIAKRIPAVDDIFKSYSGASMKTTANKPSR